MRAQPSRLPPHQSALKDFSLNPIALRALVNTLVCHLSVPDSLLCRKCPCPEPGQWERLLHHGQSHWRIDSTHEHLLSLLFHREMNRGGGLLAGLPTKRSHSAQWNPEIQKKDRGPCIATEHVSLSRALYMHHLLDSVTSLWLILLPSFHRREPRFIEAQ